MIGLKKLIWKYDYCICININNTIKTIKQWQQNNRSISSMISFTKDIQKSTHSLGRLHSNMKWKQ
jgi:hypothetical protein